MRLWDYAVAVYAIEGVQPRLLTLQDRDGADVNTILWCLWCGRERLPLASEEVPAILAEADAITEKAVRPLRQVRRNISAVDQSPFAETIAALRKDVLALELRAERLVLDTLEQATPKLGPDAATPLSMKKLASQLFTLAAKRMDIALRIDDEDSPESATALFGSILTLAEDHGP